MEVHEVARNLEQVAPQVGEVAILLVPVALTKKVKNLRKAAETDTAARSLRARSEFA